MGSVYSTPQETKDEELVRMRGVVLELQEMFDRAQEEVQQMQLRSGEGGIALECTDALRSSLERDDDWFLVKVHGNPEEDEEGWMLVESGELSRSLQMELQRHLNGQGAMNSAYEISEVKQQWSPLSALAGTFWGMMSMFGSAADTVQDLRLQVELLRVQLAELEPLRRRLDALESTMMLSDRTYEHTGRDPGLLPATDDGGGDDILGSIPVVDTCGPSIPPPPPPSMNGFKDFNPSKSKMLVVKKVKPRGPLPRARLEKMVHEHISLSDVSPANRKVAATNFLKAFPEGAGKDDEFRLLVTKYGFLIRTLPLKPLSCFKRMMYWEKHLFAKLEKEEVEQYRKRKAMEITKLESKSEIDAEIERVFKVIEQRKKDAEEQAKIAETQKVMNSMVGELKQRLDEEERVKEQEKAKVELIDMETGTLDDLDGSDDLL